MSPRAASWLAWSLWALTVVFTGMSLVLLVLILRHPGVHVFDWWVGNMLVVIDATVGAIIASRRPGNPVGWLLCLSGVAVSTSSFTSQYAIYALLARPGTLPAGEAAAWIAAWMLPIMNVLPMLYILLFPTGRLPGKRWRWLAGLMVAFAVSGVITAALSPNAYLGSLGPIRNPLGIDGFDVYYRAILYTMAPLLLALAAVSVLVRFRRAAGAERQQLKWFAYGAAMYAFGVILIVIPLAIDTPAWFTRSATVYFAAVGPVIPLSIGIAILRYRLYDIDWIINRTLVYGSLTAMLAAVYFGGVVVVQTAFQLLTGQERLPQLAVVVSTLVIAALFNPLRHQLQVFVDRRFYRQKYDAGETLAAFSAKLRDEVDLDTLNGDLIGIVRGTVQPSHVSLWLREKEPGG